MSNGDHHPSGARDAADEKRPLLKSTTTPAAAAAAASSAQRGAGPGPGAGTPRNGSSEWPGNSSFDNDGGFVTMRVDLRKVAHRLSIPLSALLHQFQVDPSSECLLKNSYHEDRNTFRVEVAIDRESSAQGYQDPIEGTPLPSPHLAPLAASQSSAQPAGSRALDGTATTTASSSNLYASRGREPSELGTAVLITHQQPGRKGKGAHSKQQQQQRTRDANTLHAEDGTRRRNGSACSDGTGGDKVLDLTHASREEVTEAYVAYLVRDKERNVTMLALPNLPPHRGSGSTAVSPHAGSLRSSKLTADSRRHTAGEAGPHGGLQDTAPGVAGGDDDDAAAARGGGGACGCIRAWFAPQQPAHESTSNSGEAACFDCSALFSDTPTVIQSVVLYSSGESLFLQVQRRIPAWGVPALLFALIAGVFLPIIYVKLAMETGPEGYPFGTVASNVWWALGELMLTTVLMLFAAARTGLRAVQPLRHLANFSPSSPASRLLLLMVVSDTARHVAQSFLLINKCVGPTFSLFLTYLIFLLVYKFCFTAASTASSSARSAAFVETLSILLVVTGGALQTATLGGFSDWHLRDGPAAGIVSSAATACYLVSAQLTIPNQPTIGLIWLCKVFSFIGAVVAVAARTDNQGFWKHWATDFMGDNHVGWIVLLCVLGVSRDALYLTALSAMHATHVGVAMVTQYVLTIVVSHALLSSSIAFGTLELGFTLPAVALVTIGLTVCINVVLRDVQYSEVDLTCRDLTRKAARPPPRLTMAALRQQQRHVKGEPPMIWKYSPPPPAASAALAQNQAAQQAGEESALQKTV